MPKESNRQPPVEQGGQIPYDKPQGCLLRLLWMAVGNLALLVLALAIGSQAGFSLLDGIYWVVVLALVLARYVDVVRLGGLTIDGEPATTTHFRRYALRLVLAALGLWILAHLLQGVL